MQDQIRSRELPLVFLGMLQGEVLAKLLLPMFGFSSKLPVTDEQRQWVDEGFSRLEQMLGRRRMLEAVVILPTAEYFPDPYDKSQAVPYWYGNSGGCAGFYSRDGTADETRMLVAVRSTQLKDPPTLVATMAHELGHVILLGGGLLKPTTPDHEPLTDLLSVFLGFGIFNANSAGRFKQYQDETRYGWSMHRLGYLAEEVYGYALAKFVVERGEENVDWAKHLSTNVQSYFKRSRSWLARNKFQVTLAKPID